MCSSEPEYDRSPVPRDPPISEPCYGIQCQAGNPKRASIETVRISARFFIHEKLRMDTETLILGAGLTGLSCAYHLESDYLLVEKENEPGGIVRTRARQPGFLCDGTGHWLHLRNSYIKELAQKL